MRIRTHVVPILVVLLLSGCSGLLPQQEALDVYRLPAHTVADKSTGPALNWQLRVAMPHAPDILEGARIAVVPTDNQISIYKGARWSDDAPRLVRNRLISAFRNDGRVAAVSSDDDSLQVDYVLGGNLDAFQSEYPDGDAKPTAVIDFNAMLINPNHKRILATHHFEFRVPASSTAVADVVIAFGQAADQLSAAVLAWTYQQVAAQTD